MKRDAMFFAPIFAKTYYYPMDFKAFMFCKLK